MEIIQSKNMGFCLGVTHVVDLAEECLKEAVEKGLPAYSIGWFIHNPHMVGYFIERGMRHIDHPQDGPVGVALIRAHGIPDPLRKEFLDAGYSLVDGTCRNVANSQAIIRSSMGNDHVVIAGIRGHSEVAALSGVCDDKGHVVPCHVVETPQDVQLLPHSKGRYLLMTQTTFPGTQYREIFMAMKERFGQKLVIGNHLCPGALRRNKALTELCRQVEAVVVVGGRTSANTVALTKIVREAGLPVWHVESASEVTAAMRSFARIGLTAGTSTPQMDIDAVLKALEGDGM
ncbi:MAG: hypothetical protein AB9828_01660 [Sphaerochaetaceae bacterium]